MDMLVSNGADLVNSRTRHLNELRGFIQQAVSDSVTNTTAESLLDILVMSVLEYWGDDPHDGPPGVPPPSYDPRYIALLYVGLESNWSFSINHACYALPPGASTADFRLAKALDILEDKVARSVTFGVQNLAGHPPFQHLLPNIYQQPARLLDSGSLEDFRFKSQNEIFIFLHHPNIRVDVVADRLLGFKKQGPNDVDPIRERNDTFYNARAVPSADMRTLQNAGTLLRVENYATGAKTVGDWKHSYSMDIRFQLTAGIGQATMLIDPDTGNGSGYEP